MLELPNNNKESVLVAYFPAFIKFDNVDILIIGGGTIATNKCMHLLDFTKKIKVIAPQLNSNMRTLIENNNLVYEDRFYKTGDIEGFNIVVIAIDDIPLQEQIYEEAKLLPNCLVNSVDSANYCDFIFPSYIKKDNLTIAISTSGSSPAVAKQLKIYLEKLIPDTIGEFLNKMKYYRETMPKGKKRMEFLNKKTKEYISTWGKK